MISEKTKTALVRLSDATKLSLEACAEKASAAVRVYRPVADVFDRARSVARAAAESEDVSFLEASESEIRQILAAVPEGVAETGAMLQLQLHAHALAAIIVTCFTAEAYANALSSFFAESGLDLERAGDKQPFERFSTVAKWERLSILRGATGLPRSTPPLSDLADAFAFRNEHAHAKVIPLQAAPVRQSKLPDPVFGHLDLAHALDVAAAYWNVSTEAFRYLSMPRADCEVSLR